ncbi:hypothetical protein HGRIS_005359 [Hohenbuehelia grisea]|uniref:Prolactin receptor n=1 Tax=Hohenbuehelia grisea TaxID=104357 RepID=A0ABR3JF90_9AGAR
MPRRKPDPAMVKMTNPYPPFTTSAAGCQHPRGSPHNSGPSDSPDYLCLCTIEHSSWGGNGSSLAPSEAAQAPGAASGPDAPKTKTKNHRDPRPGQAVLHQDTTLRWTLPTPNVKEPVFSVPPDFDDPKQWACVKGFPMREHLKTGLLLLEIPTPSTCPGRH